MLIHYQCRSVIALVQNKVIILKMNICIATAPQKFTEDKGKVYLHT